MYKIIDKILIEARIKTATLALSEQDKNTITEIQSERNAIIKKAQEEIQKLADSSKEAQQKLIKIMEEQNIPKNEIEKIKNLHRDRLIKIDIVAIRDIQNELDDLKSVFELIKEQDIKDEIEIFIIKISKNLKKAYDINDAASSKIYEKIEAFFEQKKINCTHRFQYCNLRYKNRTIFKPIYILDYEDTMIEDVEEVFREANEIEEKHNKSKEKQKQINSLQHYNIYNDPKYLEFIKKYEIKDITTDKEKKSGYFTLQTKNETKYIFSKSKTQEKRLQLVRYESGRFGNANTIFYMLYNEEEGITKDEYYLFLTKLEKNIIKNA
jgi:hypothetical protein